MSPQTQSNREMDFRVSTDRHCDTARRFGTRPQHRYAASRAGYLSRESPRAAPRRYDAVAQGLHWTIGVLVGVQLILGTVVWQMPKVRQAVLPIHVWVGITLGILAIARLVWRLRNAPPPLPGSMKLFERLSAKGAHAALQALTLLLPVSGWALLSAPDRVMSIAGRFAPTLVDLHSPFRQLRSVHGFLAASLALIVLLHAAAALRHHFWLRDDILVRMLPRRVVPRKTL